MQYKSYVGYFFDGGYGSVVMYSNFKYDTQDKLNSLIEYISKNYVNGKPVVILSILPLNGDDKTEEEKTEECCLWRLIDEEANVYDTTCQNPHILLDGSPTDNKFEFCPYCGRKIKVVE